MEMTFIIMCVFMVGMIVSSLQDIQSMTIPNWISLMMLGSFFLLAPFVWQGWAGFAEHISVALFMLVFGFVLFSLGFIGAGDAKLMTATAIWWQWPDLLPYMLYSTLAGGALAAFILMGRYVLPPRILTSPWVYKIIKDETHMPYAMALSIGALATLPTSTMFRAAAAMG